MTEKGSPASVNFGLGTCPIFSHCLHCHAQVHQCQSSLFTHACSQQLMVKQASLFQGFGFSQLGKIFGGDCKRQKNEKQFLTCASMQFFWLWHSQRFGAMNRNQIDNTIRRLMKCGAPRDPYLQDLSCQVCRNGLVESPFWAQVGEAMAY